MLKLNNTYLGYTDNFSPMKKARVEDTLDKLQNYNGESLEQEQEFITLARKEFVLLCLQLGYNPVTKDDVVRYSRKLNDYTKPKTEYHLERWEEHEKYTSTWTITKTEYDYACYLCDNDFTNNEKTIAFIKAENERKQEEEQEQIKAEQQIKEQAEQKQQEQEQFELWLNEQAEAYNNQEKLALQKEIFLAETGQYGGNSIKLLVLIDNFDDPQCKAKLKDWLSYYNTASLKTFFCITGINLGKTDKEIQARLDNISSKDFTGMIQFKARKKRGEIEQKELEAFYIYIFDSVKNGYEFQEVLAEPYTKYGLDMFIQKSNNTLRISEARTGLLIARGNTKTEMFDELKRNINRTGIDKLNEQMEQFIIKNGISPKYQEQAIAQVVTQGLNTKRSVDMHIRTIEEDYEYRMRNIMERFKKDYPEELEDLTGDELYEKIWESYSAQFGRTVMKDMYLYSGEELFQDEEQ